MRPGHEAEAYEPKEGWDEDHLGKQCEGRAVSGGGDRELGSLSEAQRKPDGKIEDEKAG